MKQNSSSCVFINQNPAVTDFPCINSLVICVLHVLTGFWLHWKKWSMYEWPMSESHLGSPRCDPWVDLWHHSPHSSPTGYLQKIHSSSAAALMCWSTENSVTKTESLSTTKESASMQSELDSIIVLWFINSWPSIKR